VTRARRLTLVEVLIAVVVCGAGISVVTLGVSTSVRAENRAGRLDRAAAYLDLLSTRLESEELNLEEAEGDFTDDGAEDLSWSIALAGTDREGLQQATLTVSWTEPSGEHELSLERLFFVDPLAGGVQ
jgi:type II secretory pathway pseudopilin PulG